nr:ubiquitin fusion degradation protein 1 homolog [Tanacetum cinerariifolium]
MVSDKTLTSGFDQYYSAFSLSIKHLQAGNKIIMPASALEKLISESIRAVFPMIFRVTNETACLYSHCGVVEFTAEEGSVLLPTWMMKSMKIQEGGLVNIKNTRLRRGKCIKLQPHDTKFITLPDHKSLLEKAFRDFVCLTTGETIEINHVDEKYLINVLETEPDHAISMLDTDCEVDLAQPLDYKEPEKKESFLGKRKSTTSGDDEDRKSCPIANDETKRFPGKGRRLGGTKVPRGVNSFNQSMKKLKITEVPTPKEVDGKLKSKQAGTTEFKPFSGVGRLVNGQPLMAVVAKDVEYDQSNVHVKVKEEEHQRFKAFTGNNFQLM